MRVEKDKVVAIHYTLTLDSGEEVDTSQTRGPLRFLVGHGQIIPGLENALMDLQVGDKKTVKVQPEEGYGMRETALIQTIEREAIPAEIELFEGLVLRGQNESGDIIEGVVKSLNDETVTIDFNHPLAGEVLTFETEVVDIRDATPEELEHGHVH